MNGNTRKRHDALSPYDSVPSTKGNPEGNRRTRAERKSDKTRLFAKKTPTKESDNMLRRIDHTEFKAYQDHLNRVRVPRVRAYQPRLCMPDGFTIEITRSRAALLLRAMRADNTLFKAIECRIDPTPASTLTRKAPTMPKPNKSTRPKHDPDPQGPRRDECTRIWIAWMNTAQKRTFEQYKEAWIASQTA